MAKTEYGVNDPLAVKLWQKGLIAEVLKKTWVQRFTGTTSSSLIQIKSETSKQAGDRIRFGLRMQLAGDGIEGDGTLEGNEEALVTFTDDVLIDQLRHAVRSGGKMSEQRVPFSVRAEARDGLADWWADRIDTAFFNQMCGFTPANGTPRDGNNTITGPDNGHRIWKNGTDDESNTSTHKFTLSLLDTAVERAKTLTPAIRPIRVDGKDVYVCFLHPYQVTDLRQDAATAGAWFDIQKASMQGGKISDNPIFTGALGMYNGVILHEANRVTQGVHSATGAAISTVRRALFCGAQAGAMAYGQNGAGQGAARFSWVEETFDYGNQLGVSAGSIFGIKKTRFDSKDFASITISTYAAAH